MGGKTRATATIEARLVSRSTLVPLDTDVALITERLCEIIEYFNVTSRLEDQRGVNGRTFAAVANLLAIQRLSLRITRRSDQANKHHDSIQRTRGLAD